MKRWILPAALAVILAVAAFIGIAVTGRNGGETPLPDETQAPEPTPGEATSEPVEQTEFEEVLFEIEFEDAADPTRAPAATPTAAPTVAPTEAPTATPRVTPTPRPTKRTTSSPRTTAVGATPTPTATPRVTPTPGKNEGPAIIIP